MKKRLLAVVFAAMCVLGAGSTVSAAPYQPTATAGGVATVDMGYIYAHMPEMAGIQQAMDKAVADGQKEFEKSVNQKMTPEQVQQVRERIANSLRQKQIDLMTPVQSKVDKAVAQIAKTHGYNVVVNSDVVVFSNTDITNEVLTAAK